MRLETSVTQPLDRQVEAFQVTRINDRELRLCWSYLLMFYVLDVMNDIFTVPTIYTIDSALVDRRLLKPPNRPQCDGLQRS